MRRSVDQTDSGRAVRAEGVARAREFVAHAHERMCSRDLGGANAYEVATRRSSRGGVRLKVEAVDEWEARMNGRRSCTPRRP